MRSVYHKQFIAPAEKREYADGRHLADAAIKKALRRGPQTPASLAKRTEPDAAPTLTKAERLERSNAPQALQEIKKIHRARSRPHLPESVGDAPVPSRSVSMVKTAQRIALHVSQRMLSANELNKAFGVNFDEAELPMRKRQLAKLHAQGHRLVTAGRYEYEFDAKGIVVNKSLRKGLGPFLNDVGVKPRQSDNALSGGSVANTGASNIWHDQPAPDAKPTQVGMQFIGVPSASQRDAAVDAIKRARRHPQKLWGNSEDRDDDLDEDDADEDEDDTSDAKNPNRDDARR